MATPPVDRALIDRALALAALGWSCKAIGAELGRHRLTILAWFRTEEAETGVKLQRPGLGHKWTPRARKPAAEKKPRPAKSPAPAPAPSRRELIARAAQAARRYCRCGLSLPCNDCPTFERLGRSGQAAGGERP